MYKSTLGTLVAAMLALTPMAHAADGTILQRALADPARKDQSEADARRHPAELLALAELRPGARVLDLVPGSGYWTRIISAAVGPKGRVYGVWPEAYSKMAVSDVQALRALASNPHYANVTVLEQKSVTLSAPERLDVVWTSQNFHDYDNPFMGKPSSAAFARTVYGLLKPGGVFVVIDHQAAPGRGIKDTDTLHRIERDTVVREAVAAGFKLEGESAVLRNAADPLTIKVFDKSIRGRTSQFALKFRKPAA